MQVINPFQMNKWGIKKFLITILSVQFLLWFLIGLDSLNIHIPILRQLIGFIYLSYIPGILILRILRQYKLNSVETTLYAVGLSIATVMFTGLFMNVVYPVIGIMPISITPLTITISLVVLLLCFLCYFKDDGINYESFMNLNEFTSPYVLLLCLLPFLSIFGTYSMNLYGNNIIQLILLLIIGLIPLITIKWIPEKFYPFEIFIISISVLFHTSLISSYIWGADINTEYFYSNLVLTYSYWNLNLYSNVNAMLSIVFLAPICSIFLNLSLVWVFKIVYPVLFSLVPLGMFILFKRVTTNKIAFLSSFFFMSTSVFFNGMPALGRQEIAEFFVVLLILLILEKQIDKVQRSLLAVIFTIALITSHYGTTYILMFIIILAAVLPIFKIITLKFKNYSISGISSIFAIFSKMDLKRFRNFRIMSVLRGILWPLKISFPKFKTKFKNYEIMLVLAAITPFSKTKFEKFENFRIISILTEIRSFLKMNLLKFGLRFKNYEVSNFEFKNYRNNLLVGNFIIFFVVLTLTWFMYVSGSSIFNNGVGIGLSITNSITDLFNPDTSQGLYILQSSFPLFQSIERYLNIVGQIFILVGILGLIFSKDKFNPEYRLLAISSFFIAIAGIIVPFFASAMNSDRLYTITLILSAPFFVIGFMKSFTFLNDLINTIMKKNESINPEKFLPVVAVFLAIFFLFSSAFVYQVFDASKPGSFAINDNIDSYDLKNPEITAIKWLKNESDPSLVVFASLYRANAINSMNSNNNSYEMDPSVFKDVPNKYLFLGRYEVEHNQMFVPQNDNIFGYTSIDSFGGNMSIIYNNGESKLFIG